MNYYKRHLGDYARKAGHLSMLEHGAYTLILDAYYDREQAPTKAEAIRWARARNPEETQTVSTILQEFFFERDGRYYQQRVEDELQEARSKAERNRIVGKFGGRPPRARKTQTVTFGLPDGFEKHMKDHGVESYPQPRADHCDVSGEQNTYRDALTNGAATRATGTKTQTVSSGLPNGFQTEPQSTNPLIQDLKAKEEANAGTADAGAGQGATKAENCPQTQIIALYHELLPELPPAREWPDANAAQLRARWRSTPERQSLDWWRKFFGYVHESDFLMGRKTDFQASLGWLVKASNFAKVVNGNYENRGNA